VAQSGWNYTSSSSNITLQFWFRCSTNQTFYVSVRAKDGTSQNYPFAFTASGNNTWTKITKTIPGAANVQFDLNNELGLQVDFTPWYGTQYTGSKALNQWSAYSGSAEYPDYASTWLTAGASTFDITGLQLEVGSVATDFEHRSFGQELALCQRYYISFPAGYIGGGRGGSGGSILLYNYYLPTPLRGSPTLEPSSAWSSSNGIRAYKYNGQSDSTNTPTLGSGGYIANTTFVYIQMGGHSIDDDRVASFTHNNTLALNAEL